MTDHEPSSARDLERKSSSVTLSDMEIFIFPEILYGLVLANIMSPRIWKWRDDPWFNGVEAMKPYKRITRLKQFIMDHYVFNLDLDTWGLTTKEREIARFKDFIDPAALRQSNALFGYEGDRYYFDIDIRTHFGLDKYEGNVIPYWKTETVEAMDAFRHKRGYATGAGECVSLAALYAAALFVVARVPLRDIFLLATPLHSQNFVHVDDGILTNNRRLVTKNMWFNGTELSAQARRALENEQVTVVTHESGWIHVLFPEATIDSAAYAGFETKLLNYLRTEIDEEILGNFLRHTHDIQQCFQMRWHVNGANRYIDMERVFRYEEDTSYTIASNTRAKLMAEIDCDEFQPDPIPHEIVFNDLEAFVKSNRVRMDNEAQVKLLKEKFACSCMDAEEALDRLVKFCCVKPRLPVLESKTRTSLGVPLGIDLSMTRDQIIARLESIRAGNIMAEAAFCSYRDLNRVDPAPFMLAAIKRNPVCIQATRNMDENEIVTAMRNMPDESIYDEPGRLAQPDEVWNYGRGDGAEKAILLANVAANRNPAAAVSVEISDAVATCRIDGRSVEFPTGKGLKPGILPVPR